MNIRHEFVTVVAVFCATASLAFAPSADAESSIAHAARAIQSATSASLTPEEMKAIERWVRDYKKWKTWYAKWRNQVEPGLFGSTRERRPRPDPPAALATICPVPLDETGVLGDACQLYKEWTNDDMAADVIKQ